MTSLTVNELEALVPPFEAAFLQDLAAWTLHGRRRPLRRYTTSKNCHRPTAEDRLLFMLVSLKQHTLHTRHGRVCGMRQSKAHRWIHVFLPVWRTALRPLGDAPCRSVEALRQRLAGEAPPLPLTPCELETAQAALPTAAPLFVMTVLSDPFRVRPTRRNSTHALAARPSSTC